MAREKEQDKKRTSPPSEEARRKADSGNPGGGAGRTEEAGGSGVYPASGPLPEGNAPYRGEAGWGQGSRGEQGYEDSGDSEITTPEAEQGDRENSEGGQDLGHSDDGKDAHDRRAQARKKSQ